MDTRADLDADALLKIVLVLVVLWVAVEIIDFAFEIVEGVLELFMPIIGILIVVLIVLWLVDQL
jgi:hypothetical protein